MERREFIKNTAWTAVCAASGNRAWAGSAEGRQKQPNILLIMTDQQHAGMMSCAGDQWVNTPAMDSLARDGIRFEKAYSSNPVCVPSRTAMATGVMPDRLNAPNNSVGIKKAVIPSNVYEHSLGKTIKSAGYDTFYGGKVHMCETLQPLNSGYDEYFKDERDELPDVCLEFITRKRNKPFFAVASFINPHDICYEYTAYKNRKINSHKTEGMAKLYHDAVVLTESKLPPLPSNYPVPDKEPAIIDKKLSSKAVTPARIIRDTYDEREWRIYRWIYRRLTEKVDGHVGRILDGLKDAGLEENTLVVFVSDHGDMDAAHRLASKSQFYDESARVPFIMKYPGIIPAGVVEQSALVTTGLDLLPTLRDYAGVQKLLPNHLLGRSLRDLAEGRTSVPGRRSYVVSENAMGGRMIRTGKYKYCVYDDNGRFEESLVDMEADPGELNNLVRESEYQNELVRHRAFLKEWIKISGDTVGEKYLTRCMSRTRQIGLLQRQ